MSIQQYYKVEVTIDDKTHWAVFYKCDNNQYDLRYGWGAYLSGQHDSLEDAKKDFLDHLERKNPGKKCFVGEHHEITEDEAKTLSPTYENLRG